MTTNETIMRKQTNGLDEPVQVPRLDEAEREAAVRQFVWGRLGTECSDDDFDSLANGCRVLYEDDYDSGASRYQIVDEQGHGDGTGEWHDVRNA